VIEVEETILKKILEALSDLKEGQKEIKASRGYRN